jgi:hypothetical protein
MSNAAQALGIWNTAAVCVLVCSLVSEMNYADVNRDMTIPLCAFRMHLVRGTI